MFPFEKARAGAGDAQRFDLRRILGFVKEKEDVSVCFCLKSPELEAGHAQRFDLRSIRGFVNEKGLLRVSFCLTSLRVAGSAESLCGPHVRISSLCDKVGRNRWLARVKLGWWYSR